MADNGLKISVTDEGSARSWLSEVHLANEDFHEAMGEAAQTLQEAREFGEGTVVDEFFDLGTNLLNSAQKVYNAIDEISTTVNKVLGVVTAFAGEASGIIGAASKLLG